jgi:hypothetical protein
MAIIYSYPTVTPTSEDLILGTDINADGKPTKNFTIQSIVDIVQGGAAGLGAVIKINSSAKDPATAANQSAIDFLNISGTGTASFGALSDGTLQITGGNLTTSGSGIFNQITGTLQTAAQPNITSLGTLTSLIVNTSVTGTAVVTTLATPGDDLKIASTKAIVDYIATKPNKETLAETLIAGQTTGGKDIIVSAGDDITFTDTSKIILGAGSDATVEHDGTDLKIINTEGKTTISNNSGDIEIIATAANKKSKISGKVGVELQYDGSKTFETISNGSIATGTFNTTGLLTAQTNLWFKDKIGIGGAGAPNYGTSGQVLSSGGALGDATWEDLTPLYTWIIEADSGTGQPYTVASGDTIDFVGGDNINTSWVNAGKELKIDATGVVQKGTGAATQVAYWTDANTIAGDAGMTYDAANDYLTLAGTVKSGKFTTTAGTATWITTVLDGFTSITSDLFVGDATAATVPSSPPWPANPTANVQFQGNASSANVLKLVGAVSISQGAAPSAGAENTQGVSSVAGQTYTSGGNITIETTLASTVATAKRLTNLPTPTSAAIAASDTILAAMAKLQGQINGLAGSLAFEGTWDASAGTAPSASPVNGQFWIVSVAGNTDLDGITDWKVGDWAIYVDNGAGTDAWQKLDQSNEVLGSGTAQKMAMWSGTVGDASQTLATGLIEQNATNNLITIGNSGSLLVEGNTTLGDSNTDTVLAKGPVTLNETLNIKKGIEVNGAAGTSGQVLTSGSGSTAVMSWTTPTTGTVTNVALTETGNALTITGSPVTSSGTINIAGAGSASQYINGELNLVTFPTVDNYVSWTLAGDSGPSQTISSTNTATFAGGFGISTVASATDTLTTAIDIVGTDNAIAGLTAATPLATDTLWFNDISDSNTIRKATISDIVALGDQGLPAVLAINNTTGSTNIVVQKSIQLPVTSTNNNSPTDVGVISFGGTYTNGNRIYNHASGGTLRIEGSDNLQLYAPNFQVSNSNGVLITAGDTGTSLRYQGSEKLTTTNTGIEVSGTSSSFAGNVTIPGAISAGANGGLRIHSSGTKFFNVTAANAARTNIMDIGAPDARFKSLYLGTDADIQGNVQIDGNLTVDGHIIHGGGGGGTGKGGQFTKLYTTGNAGVAGVAFTIDRATTGAMVFDVMLTSDTSTTCAVAKKYTVVCTYGATAPIYNKILDTGPDGSNDFTVAFADDTSNTKIKCTITPTGVGTQKIGITIDLGFGQNDATVVMN